MEDYNQQDAKSVLEYIYRNYGKTVFQEKGKARAYFNDLAPQLSKDRNMLKVLDEIGVLQDLCSVNSDDRDRQKKALRIAEEKVTKNTPLDDKYVISGGSISNSANDAEPKETASGRKNTQEKIPRMVCSPGFADCCRCFQLGKKLPEQRENFARESDSIDF